MDIITMLREALVLKESEKEDDIEVRENPKIKLGNKVIDLNSVNIQDLRNQIYNYQGFQIVSKLHPTIKALMLLYQKQNPIVYSALQSNACIYAEKIDAKFVACVFYDPLENKFCLAWNPVYLNLMIDNFEELYNKGVIKSFDDDNYSSTELELLDLKKINFLVAHELSHIFSGDIERSLILFKKSGNDNLSKEENELSNIAQDAVHNQNLLKTEFPLGGQRMGYKMVPGGWLMNRDDSQKNADVRDAGYISDINEKEPYDMENVSEIVTNWLVKNKEKFYEYEKKQDKKKEDKKKEKEQEKKQKEQKDQEQEYSLPEYAPGDPVYLPELGKFGKIVSIDGDEVEVIEISQQEANHLAPAQPRIKGFASYSPIPEYTPPFVLKMKRIMREKNNYRLIEKILLMPRINLQELLK